MSTLLKTSTLPAAKNKTSRAEGVWAGHCNLQAARQMFSCLGGCASIARAVNPAAAKDEEFRKWCLHVFASAMELRWRDWHSWKNDQNVARTIHAGNIDNVPDAFFEQIYKKGQVWEREIGDWKQSVFDSWIYEKTLDVGIVPVPTLWGAHRRKSRGAAVQAIVNAVQAGSNVLQNARSGRKRKQPGVDVVNNQTRKKVQSGEPPLKGNHCVPLGAVQDP